jgi:ABC-type glycerol-3-phosphate transport system permease component
MPHIAVVGRRAPQARLLIAGIYALLSVGAVTMVVPFWLMVSSSFTSNVDSNDFRLVPAYWYDNEAMYRKYMESACNEDSTLYNYVTSEDIGDFLDVKAPQKINERQVKDYTDWKEGLPLTYTFTAHAYSVAKPKISLEGAHLYQQFLAKRYNNDIGKLNKAYREDREYFDLQLRREEWHKRLFQPLKDLRYQEQMEFKKTLPTRFRIPAPVEGMFHEFLTNQDFGTGQQAAEPKTFAQRYGLPITSWADIHLPERIPTQANFAADWLKYVRTEAPYQFVVMEPGAQPAFTQWLKKRYGNDLRYLQRVYGNAGKQVKTWEDVVLSPTYPWDGIPAADWGAFLEDENGAPAKFIRLDTPQVRYRNWLRSHYKTIAAVNQAYGTSFRDFDAAQLPVKEAHWSYMLADRGAIKRDFIVRNYRDVMAYISVHGKSLRNTFILVLCVLALTLTINPLSAYALSRYNLPATYKILLFFLATMAFPAEVTAIPNFLLMKQLHLLNTFFALILPGAANGFSIFLLKGFFDGLPRDLYEAAELDGATETQMFTRICLPMSTPVLAVIGLGAFTAAYGSFMWAFVVCQDKNMWTLMVWLQQMGSWAPQSMIYAALVLAAIPTLLVFIFAQDIIMRGVIIPMEK